MLTATTFRQFNDSRLSTTIFLERELRAHLVERDRLVFDSNYVPPIERSNRVAHVYLQLDGFFAIEGQEPQPAPVGYLLAEEEFDCVQAGWPRFRSWGAPGVILEVRVSTHYLVAPVGIKHGPLSLGPAVWAACAELRETKSEQSVKRALAALADANVFEHRLLNTVVDNEPERFQRLWDVLRPLYAEMAVSSSLKQIAVLTRLSLRQLGRDLGDLTKTFGLLGGGFREAMRVLRLRAAVLILSAPGVTPSEVAKIVGYGSLDAMGRAFRDATLPAPSVVQAAVRYPI
ncbi:MAG TPA: hypothetical protein VGM90_26285 [Kofleriaceae bacterium]|jgi:AraC-like DNA-binding protein